MNTILTIYVIGVVAVGMFSALYIAEDSDIKGVDNFWDWLIFSVFWPIQPIKAIVKFIKNIAK